ncbi:MAG: YczE/YyaS/YitT family protein [Candidatus Nanopelagicaceae bacterium]|jgi:uncharacterized membrane protein YczE
MHESSWVKRFFDFFKPHRHLPHLPWTASHPWDVSMDRLAILVFGLAFFGLGDALIIVSSLGNAPWSVLAQGLAITLDISIGIATIFVGFTVLALWIPLKRKIGIGTLLNIVVISLFIDLGIYLFQKPSQALFQYLSLLLGIILVGLGSALYLTCGLGAGPRDGLMTGLNERTGIRIGRIRLTLEVVVLTLGALLGGTVGVGTALFALLIGQSVAIWLGVVSRSTSR